MKNPFGIIKNRSRAKGLPAMEEIEQFGTAGEEAVCRELRKHFSCVVRNVAVPHKELYLEKDLMVVHQDSLFVIEVKHWKGEIGQKGDRFYQKKDNGEYKEQKSPVGTTNQFIHRMKKFYGIERPVWGVVVFSEPDCTLCLPRERDGVALLPLIGTVEYIRERAESEPKSFAPINPDRILRCTRFYSEESEFCKGILADTRIECMAEDGATVALDTTKLRYITVENQPLRMRDKLYVTYAGGGSGVFYNRDAVLTVACLDGSYRKIALNRVRHVVF